MKDLLKFIVKNLLGNDDFEIVEENVNNKITLTIKAKTEYLGLLIGKGGKTIKNIRSLVKVKAVLDNLAVDVAVAEK